MLFTKNQYIADYKVVFPIKSGDYAETYRVKGTDGKLYFLKLFNYSKLHASQFGDDLCVLEVEISKQLQHENIVKYHDSGDFTHDGNKLGYLVHDFVSGETVAERMSRESLSVYDAKQIAIQVLTGLMYLHSCERSIIHNDISIQNTILDLSFNPCVAKIIDFGHARYFDQKRMLLDKRGVNLFTIASEVYNGIYTPQSDLFSVGVMLYQMIYKTPPYFIDLSNVKGDISAHIEAIFAEREAGLKIPCIDLFELDEDLTNIIAKALANDVDSRFKSAEEFIKALRGEIKIERPVINKSSNKVNKTNTQNIKKGNGFSDVVGLDELKERLKADVIEIFNNPEEAESWGLSLPNGMLLYGPPGCGKTFLAEKFAEEAGWNYICKHCSDLGTSFIHGAQMNIGAMFDEARKNAPTILFLDEVEALITKRELHRTPDTAGEVNEFLVQLNNCGKDNVFVIAATNHPELIDSAALRAGRLELKYYMPLPDKTSRENLFKLYLGRTKADFGLDYEMLADKTERYNSREVQQIVEEAGRLARRQKKVCITMDLLLDVISKHVANISEAELKEFEKIRDSFDAKKQPERKRIGFY